MHDKKNYLSFTSFFLFYIRLILTQCESQSLYCCLSHTAGKVSWWYMFPMSNCYTEYKVGVLSSSILLVTGSLLLTHNQMVVSLFSLFLLHAELSLGRMLNCRCMCVHHCGPGLFADVWMSLVMHRNEQALVPCGNSSRKCSDALAKCWFLAHLTVITRSFLDLL